MDRKKRKKKNWNPLLVSHAGWPARCTGSVGGKGRASLPTLVQLWTWSKTPATGAVDLIATRIPPGPDTHSPQTTAVNYEKTCDESNRCPKTLKKTKGFSKKKDAPKKQKKLQNRLKIEPGGPKMDPGCTKSEAKIEKKGLNRPKWLLDGSQDPFTQKVP